MPSRRSPGTSLSTTTPNGVELENPSLRSAYPQVKSTGFTAGSFRDWAPPWLWWLGCLVPLGIALGVATTSSALVQAGLGLAIAVLLVAGCLIAPRMAMAGLVAWLGVIGTLRRVLLGAGAAGDQDALLLVAPAVVAVLVVLAAAKGAFRGRTTLTNAVLALTVLILLSPLNPLHGGVAVGVAGWLFVLVPPLWFWVGRAFVDDRLLGRLLRVLSVVAFGAAIYGLFQAYQGFPPWDQTWIDAKGYTALRVGDSLRQFASFVSTAEYVGVLALAIVVLSLGIKRGSPIAMVRLAAIPLLGWAVVVASVRGALVMLPVVLGILFAIRRGVGVPRVAAAGVASLVVLGLLVSSIDPGSVGGTRTSALLSRQVEGLADPLNPAASTLPAHFELLLSGIGQAFLNPIGQGLGVVTRAGAVFGSGTESTETDPSNVAVALGLPGLAAYLTVVVVGLRLAFRRARARRDYFSLVALGILLITLPQWLNGGAYLVAPFPWLVLGWLDRSSHASAPEVRDPAEVQHDITSSKRSATMSRVMARS